MLTITFWRNTSLLTVFFFLTFFSSITVKANDSDVVNCNRAWKIIVMGSSTAYGTGASSYDSSWTGRFSQYMQRRNPGSQIINLAIPGITTYQNLRPDNYLPPVDRPLPIQGNNITAALALQPDAIIINMPSNDANNLYTLEEQQANFEAAIYLADSAHVPVWITTSQPRNNMSVEQISLLTSFRDWVLTRFVDKAVDFWSDVANPDGSIVDFYDYDYVHVNNNGHALFYNRMRAETILDTLCNRYTGTLTIDAGNDTVLTLPTNFYAVPLTAISSSGSIQSYSWRKISGPSSFVFQNENTASPEIANLIEGRYSFEVTVADDRDNIKKDTISIIVQSRILIDFGQTPSAVPDVNGNYWNNVLNATEGLKIANAITAGNSNSGLSLEIINRIDGTFNLAGPGVNTGNTTGDIRDYPASATTDYAFAHPSTDIGLWRIGGLDSLKEYSVKFWGSRTVTDTRVIEIKMSDETIWQSFDAQNNINYDQAAVFTITGKSTVDFNIRVAVGSSFGHIGVVDIFRTSSSASVNILPHANAGNDVTIIIPDNAVNLIGTSSIDDDGDIVAYSWRKIAGPQNYSIGDASAAQTTVSNLTEGSYQFELKVTDDRGGIGKDTVNVIVGSRILIDFGPTVTSSPDAGGKYWNLATNATNGVKLSNAVTTQNVFTSIGLEVINRIDGTFNTAGQAVNTGNIVGAVGDYPSSATTDYAFADPSSTNGQWKIFGLDSSKTYTIKFWGTRSVADPRFIEIKLNEETNWKTYNAANNADFNQAAVFTFTGKSEAFFDIRVPSGSSFGYISVIDIFKYNNPSNNNLTPQAVAGNDVNLTLPSNLLTLNGSNSSDPDGFINEYHWTKISGPDQYEIVSPDDAITVVNNLAEGTYQFELFVSDDNGLTDRDTVTVRVSSRILFDFGATLTPLPDVNGNYWNNITSANEGVKVVNAISVSNAPSGISMEVINRIDGTFNLAGPGVNTGNTIGVVNDYLNSATTDYAFAHPTATNGKWKFSGLDSTKQYSIKFWGTRSVADARIIEIKTEEDTNWKSFNATNNSNYNEAAVFDVIRKKDVIFDIRVQAGSSFGHISVVDINMTTPIVNCSPDTVRENASACGSYDWNGNTYTASGTYSFVTTNANGCDSTAILELTINAATSSNTVASACGSYDWNGNTYTASGTYSFVTTNANGCDSTAILELTINAATSSNTVASACGPYDWNGNTYTASGTYSFVTTNANGCDSTAILELTISAATSSNTVASACGPYDWNGNTYTASGTYSFVSTNANGCDSTAILELTISAATSSNTVASACGPYDWNGNTYTASGTYSFVTTNANGCDSTAILELTISAATSSNTVASACGPYDWNGNTYTASGTYSFVSTNANGCDSTAILELTISAATSSNTVASACGPYDWNGNTYTASGTYSFVTTNANGCDSTAILELTINAATSSNTVASACGPYDWNGNTYTASGTYSFVSTNANGCDSTAILELTISAATSSNTVASACGPYDWNGNTYTASGTYSFVSTNANGCDSTAILELTISAATSSNTVASACGPYDWNGNTYTASGTYSFVSTNANGCDSTAILELTISAATSSNTVASACGPYDWNGNTYTASGTYSFVSTNANGCDSTAILELTISAATSSNTVASACGPYDWNGNTYTASGTYSIVSTNANGCDSTAILELTISAATSSNTVASACGPYDWNGNTYTASGTYSFVTTNANGCDSTAILELTISAATSSNTVASACGPYDWNGNTYTASGTYSFVTTNANGCDSTAILELTINAATSSNTVASACGPYDWNGNTYTASGTYSFVSTNANGCDSTAILELTISAATSSNTVASACGPYDWNGNTYTASGTYSFVSTNANGCDSTAILELTISAATSSNTVASACGPYDWNGNTYTASGTYSFVSTNANGCDSTAILELTISAATSSNTVASACGPYDWNGNTYTASGTYSIVSTNANGCDSTAILELTISAATSSNTVASACGPYDWNGNTYTASGTYSFVTTNANGCDSTAILELTISAATSSNTVASACGPYDWNGNTYTASGTYSFVTTNANGCDSTAILELTISAATSSNTVASACGPYDWNGNTYTASGTYSFVTTNANGCDSTAILELTISAATSSNTVASACGPYDWNGNTYTASGTYSFVTTNANGCDSTSVLELTIFPVPFTVGNIVGPVSVCLFSGPLGQDATYVINVVNAASIEWEIPEDAVIVSQTANSITLHYSLAFTVGTITATVSSACGEIQVRTLAINGRAPASPGAIRGLSNVCNFVGTQQLVNYSVTTVPNVLYYKWLLPASITLVSANQDSSSINVIINSSFTTLLNRTIKVQSISGCGVSGYTSLTLSFSVPSTPSVITGPANGCLYTSANSPAQYKINKVLNATSYNWQMPAGVTILSHPAGLGENDTIINVQFSSSYVSSSTITVSAQANCGVSAVRSFTLTKLVPSAPYVITGPTNVCGYLGNDSAVTYTVRKVANANAYNWVVPSGVTISHPAGLGVNDTIVVLRFPAVFSSGTLTVSAANGCGVSNSSSLTLTNVIVGTPVISGPTDACQYVDSAATYTIRKVNGAISYNWILPSTGISTVNHPNGLGINDTIIEVVYLPAFVRGTISVSASSSCNTGGLRSLSIGRRMPSTPGVISSSIITAECPKRRYVYAISALPSNANATIWTVPAGASIDSGQGGLRIYVSYSPLALVNQNVTVVGVNGCGAGTSRSLVVNIAACVVPPFAGNTQSTTLKTIPSNLGEVSPNPSSNYFKLNLPLSDHSPVLLRVRNILGKVIMEKKISNPAASIVLNAEYWTNGVYYCEWSQGNSSGLLKLIKL